LGDFSAKTSGAFMGCFKVRLNEKLDGVCIEFLI
jgi:hypothetical protein